MTSKALARIRMCPREWVSLQIHVALFSACAAGVCQAQDNGQRAGPPVELAELRQRMTTLVESGELASISVGVVRSGELVWLESFGYADRENRIDATPSTSYPLGSLSKSFAGTVAMAMQEDGVLDLDAPVNSYIEAELELPDGRAWSATTADALHMVAGVPHGWFSVSTDAPARSAAQVVAEFGRPITGPGVFSEYSNFSIAVAQAAMEGAADRSFGELLRQYVIQPLGMNATAINSGEADGVAVRYSSRMTVMGSKGYPEAALGLRSSVSDLLAFARFHMNAARSGDPGEQSARMYEGSSLSSYGLGIGVIRTDELGTVLISNGSIGGANSNLMILPDSGHAVVVLTNTTSSQADPLAVQIMEAMVPGFGEEFISSITRSQGSSDLAESGDAAAFDGVWHGSLSNQARPELETIPVTLHVAADSVLLGIGGAEPGPVRRARIGANGSLRLSLSLELSDTVHLIDDNGGTATGLYLFPVDSRLVGYLSVLQQGTDYSASRPLAVQLTRVDR